MFAYYDKEEPEELEESIRSIYPRDGKRETPLLSCRSCTASFCSELCQESSLWHPVYCSDDLLQSAVASRPSGARVELAMRCVLYVWALLERRSQTRKEFTIQDAVLEVLGGYECISFSLLSLAFDGEDTGPGELLPEPFSGWESAGVTETSQRWWEEHMAPTQKVMANALAIGHGIGVDSPLVSTAFLDRLFGYLERREVVVLWLMLCIDSVRLIALNTHEIQVPSPLPMFFNQVQRSPFSMSFLSVIFKIEREFGGSNTFTLTRPFSTITFTENTPKHNPVSMICVWSTLLIFQVYLLPRCLL